jgi:hypothetical protein
MNGLSPDWSGGRRGRSVCWASTRCSLVCVLSTDENVHFGIKLEAGMQNMARAV